MDNQLRVGFAGIRRSMHLLGAVQMHPRADVVAFCDLDAQAVETTAAAHDAAAFTDYQQMLDAGGLDAVVIATPMQLHAQQSIDALARGIHVLSEVTAGVTVQECKSLVAAAEKSEACYMLAENCCYVKENMLINQLVQAGRFGEIYYAEGEYLHQIRDLIERTEWRQSWQAGVNGCTYGTHSLGPILQWFKGQRVVAVSCVGSGHHYRQPNGEPYPQEDTVLMLCRMSGGGLVKIRVDLLSNRPQATMNYALQGTAGAYESPRAKGQSARISFATSEGADADWELMDQYEQQYLPDLWRNATDEITSAGHNGIDHFVVHDFIESLIHGRPSPIGIHEAMDMTLPGLISQQSIAQGGAWLDVPDSRRWAPQLQPA